MTTNCVCLASAPTDTSAMCAAYHLASITVPSARHGTHCPPASTGLRHPLASWLVALLARHTSYPQHRRCCRCCPAAVLLLLFLLLLLLLLLFLLPLLLLSYSPKAHAVLEVICVLAGIHHQLLWHAATQHTCATHATLAFTADVVKWQLHTRHLGACRQCGQVAVRACNALPV